VLVDLAMISAQGQDDLEVQRVSCLHAAATGYAPLIYDIRLDMGFTEFLPLCQAVWRTLEVDDQLPKKFVGDCVCFCNLTLSRCFEVFCNVIYSFIQPSAFVLQILILNDYGKCLLHYGFRYIDCVLFIMLVHQLTLGLPQSQYTLKN